MITLSIGSRIRFIRMKRGWTQKELGMKLGFKESTAEVRIAQYESDLREPRKELLQKIADTLEVSVVALTTETKTNVGILHSLFALEDESCFRIDMKDGQPVLIIDENDKSDSAILMRKMLKAWLLQSLRLKNEQITQKEYDDWRYNFPKKFDDLFFEDFGEDFHYNSINDFPDGELELWDLSGNGLQVTEEFSDAPDEIFDTSDPNSPFFGDPYM